MKQTTPDYSVGTLGTLVLGLIFAALLGWAAMVLVAVPTSPWSDATAADQIEVAQ